MSLHVLDRKCPVEPVVDDMHPRYRKLSPYLVRDPCVNDDLQKSPLFVAFSRYTYRGI